MYWSFQRYATSFMAALNAVLNRSLRLCHVSETAVSLQDRKNNRIN